MFVCPVPKISRVMMKWRRRAVNSVDLLYGATAAELLTQQIYFVWHRMAAELHNSDIYFVAQRPPS